MERCSVQEYSFVVPSSSKRVIKVHDAKKGIGIRCRINSICDVGGRQRIDCTLHSVAAADAAVRSQVSVVCNIGPYQCLKVDWIEGRLGRRTSTPKDQFHANTTRLSCTASSLHASLWYNFSTQTFSVPYHNEDLKSDSGA